MKKLSTIICIICLLVGQISMGQTTAYAEKPASSLQSNDKSGISINENTAIDKAIADKFIVRIFKTTTKQQLENYKEMAAEAGITIEYKNIQYVNGELESLTMMVDCNDGYKGNFSTVNIPEEGVGFYRDYSEDAESAFEIGEIFGKGNSERITSNDYETPFNKESGEKVKRKKSRNIHDHEVEFLIGLNNYLTPEGSFPDKNDEIYSIDAITSWTYAINSVHTINLTKQFKANFQFGIQWYNFALQDPSYQITKGLDSVQFVDRSLENPDRSKLNITYLNAGVLPVFYFGKSSSSFRLGAGVYGGYKIGSKSKFKYDNGEKDLIKKNFYLNNVHYGVQARVGWKDIDLFATYDLNNLFIDNRGPRLHAFSFGIVL